MGAPLTKQRGVCVRGKNETRKYVPLTSYTPFPEERRKAPGELISQFPAFPAAPEPVLSDSDLYWWTDCDFMPYNDSTIFTSSGAYQPRLHHPWIADKRVPTGRLCRFDFDKPKLRCEVFAGTKTTAYPQVKFHPDSFHVGFLGSGEVQLVTLENTGFHSKARDLTFRTYKHFDISPDGEWYVVMARNYSSGEYDLLLFSSKVVTNVENAVSLKKLNPEFKGLRSYNEHSYCKWSPDSCYIGVSIYSGAFMVLKRQKLTLIANIFPDIIPDSTLSICNTFDFNPRYGHQFVAMATSDRQLYVVDVDNGHIVSQSSEVCSNVTIDTLKYTYNGNCVGVATQDFMIYLYDQDVSSVIYSLDMKVSCPGIQNPLTGSYQAITKLSFSMCGEQVMVATSDGLVRLWQLPPTINLQNICKLKILSYLPIGRVKMLPLPTDMIDYLLDIPITSENIEMSGVVRNVDNSKDKKEQEESLTHDTTYKHFVLRETPKLISFKNVNTDFSKLKTVKW